MSDYKQRDELERWSGLLRRYWWLLVSTIVVTATAAGVVAFSADAKYRATADVLLSNRDLAALLIGTQSSAPQDPQRTAETQAKVARSPDILAAALSQTDAPGMTVVGLLDASSVSTSLDSDILTFAVTDSSSIRAEALAEAYAAAYASYRLEIDTSAIRSAREALAARIADLRGEQAGDAQSSISTLEEKDQELQTLAALQTSNAYVVRVARAPVDIASGPVERILIGALMGGIVALVVIGVLGYADPRVRDPEAILSQLGAPELGRVPWSRRHLGGEGAAVVAPPNSSAGEAYRTLRSNLRFVLPSQQSPVIAITSASPGEGKTTTAINLAAALARTGARVAVVDLDLRKPRIAPALGLLPYPGVSDIYIGQSSIGSALQTVHLDSDPSLTSALTPPGSHSAASLLVLPSGSPPPNPGEMAVGAPIAHLVRTLAQQVDFVLIDTPPLGRVADASTMSSFVDGFLLVSRPGQVNRRDLRALVRALATTPGPILGVMFNGIGRSGRYDYGGGYGDAPSKTARHASRHATTATSINPR